MVQYYNFSAMQNTDGFMGFLRVMSEMSKYSIGIFLQLVVFILPMYVMYKKDGDLNSAANVSSLYATLIGVFFYMTRIVPNSLCIWIPALIFIITVVVRWSNRSE